MGYKAKPKYAECYSSLRKDKKPFGEMSSKEIEDLWTKRPQIGDPYEDENLKKQFLQFFDYHENTNNRKTAQKATKRKAEKGD